MNMEVFGLVQYILWLLFTLAFLLAAVAFTHYVSSDAVGVWALSSATLHPNLRCMCVTLSCLCALTPKSEVHAHALEWPWPLASAATTRTPGSGIPEMKTVLRGFELPGFLSTRTLMATVVS
jgi:hypothetical protein